MYEKQMELFEEGGEVDEVSGNDVPLGSTKEEVRDDQPAMLSEGEMVVPADVVRYFGVEYFMNLRDQAKMGYKKMEAMGQFGTEEGQTLPDNTIFNAGGPPFTIEDIEVIENEMENEDSEEIEAKSGALVKEYAEGGMMTTSTPQMIGTATPASAQPAIGTTILPDMGREATLPTPQGLGQFVGSTGMGQFEAKFYMDPTGNVHQVFYMQGLPQQEVDEDWIEIDSAFELRSYRELAAGRVSDSVVAPTKRTEDFSGDGGQEDPGNIGSVAYGDFGTFQDSFGYEFGLGTDPNISDPNVQQNDGDAEHGGPTGPSGGDADPGGYGGGYDGQGGGPESVGDPGGNDGDSSNSDDGGPESSGAGAEDGSEYKQGGFVKKRKYKKKKKRRSLASR
jgi:hypothetical protein